MVNEPAFWQAVAQSIDAEESKARLFVHHSPSLGVAREAILRNFLREHTPAPFVVRTGFVHQMDHALGVAPWCSRQCDILVYDPTQSQPDYRIEDLVVVGTKAVRALAEVKTDLDESRFKEVVEFWNNVAHLKRRVYAFAFDGVTFNSFLQYLDNALTSNPQGLPDCIAVHRRNYLFVRTGYDLLPSTHDPLRHWPASNYWAIDFGINDDQRGAATGALLSLYLKRLTQSWNDDNLRSWVSSLALPPTRMVMFNNDGTRKAHSDASE